MSHDHLHLFVSLSISGEDASVADVGDVKAAFDSGKAFASSATGLSIVMSSVMTHGLQRSQEWMLR